MDADWAFSSCSWPMEEDAALKNACTGSDWTREEDKAFENALAIYYNDADMWDKIALAVPGKTIDDLKLHYEALKDDVEAIESGKVPLPNYASKVSAHKGKKSPGHGVQARATPWTEEEHRQFLYGLQRFGRGDWRSISRYSVRTKSNSQVASHAQKYFKRLSSVKEGKRLSIYDVTSVNPEELLALEKVTTSCMPVCCKEKSSNAGTEKELLPANAREQLMPRCPTRASTVDGNELLLGFPEKAPTDSGNQLQTGCAKKAPTDIGYQLLHGFPVKAPTDTGNQLKSGYANAGYQQLLGYPVTAPTDTGNQQLSGYPKKAPTEARNHLLPPLPLVGASDASPLSSQAIGGLRFSASILPACSIPSPPFAREPIQGPRPANQEPGVSVETPGFYPTDAVMQDANVGIAGEYDFGCSTEIMDLDMSLFPHFLD